METYLNKPEVKKGEFLLDLHPAEAVLIYCRARNTRQHPIPILQYADQPELVSSQSRCNGRVADIIACSKATESKIPHPSYLP